MTTSAQPVPRMVRIGFLGGGAAASDASVIRGMLDPFRQGLREFGYVEGRNLNIEFRFAEGRLERLPDLLADLLRFRPDVLVTSGPGAARLAHRAADGLPVLALAIDDPVEMGLAASYARPGGNVTGVSASFSGILPKRLQLLKDIVPKAQRFAILFNPDSFPPGLILKDLPDWERGLAMKLPLLQARGPGEFDAAFQSMVAERVDGVAVLAD
ncbi:MAG: ABC transporter substrate-binding protein, partial [Burkholderiaceae bacterium]